jgi:enoyl-CoA hydratase/3-hydroxyacyl-CoA dehydrogenase
MSKPEIRKVAVVGAGEMGHGIAQLLAQNGFEVRLLDKYPEALRNARGKIEADLRKLVERQKIGEQEAQAALARIAFSGDMAASVKDADLVIEAVPEILDLKKSIFRELDSEAPLASILASNTSNIKISDLAAATARPDKVVGLHFFNPPTRMKLVEVIPGSKTDPKVVEAVSSLCTKLGRTPVKVAKDSPGFIVNRINAADILLFGLILDKGMAAPEEVDSFAKAQGLPMGPYELLDFVGIDVANDSLEYFAGALSPEYGKPQVFKRMVKEGKLGRKTGGGFYSWASGRASIPKAEPTDKLAMMDLFSVEINEAVKLIEEGVSTPDDIDKSVMLGMNRPFGPISVAKSFTNAEIRSKLEEMATRFDCPLFAPAKPILEGKLREAIEGRLQMERAAQATPPPSELVPNQSLPVYLERLGGRVARIVINRPKHNTLNAEVLEGLDRIMDELWDDKEVSVVLVTGQGSTFSAGADLSQFFASSLDFMDFAARGARLFKRLTEFPKLTIAVMKGSAIGGGLELALSCDLRIGTEDVKMGFTEVTLGIVPGWSGTQRLTKLIGLSRASQLILTGNKISGREALALGILFTVAPQGDPDAYAQQVASELASKLAPVAVMLAKRLINRGGEVPSDVGLEMEAMAMGILFGTDDLKEGISAFFQKRKPDFKGK